MNLTHTKQKNQFLWISTFYWILVFVFICIQRHISLHTQPISKKNIHTYKMISMHIVMWNVFWIARYCDVMDHRGRNPHSTWHYSLQIFWISCRSVELHRSYIHQKDTGKNHYFNIVSISLHCTQLTSFQHMPSTVTIGTLTYNMYRAYLLPKLALGI